MMKRFLWVLVLLLPVGLAAQQAPKKRVVEEIVARVNNEIITLSEYESAKQSLRREAEEECQGCAREKLETMVAEREKNLLRDLIDNMLLVQRAKDLGFNVETDLIKYMDRIRLEQKPPLEDLEALCRAVESTGVNCEDWKSNIRNRMLSQEVMRREVGRMISISREEVQAYYDEHKKEFVRPEQVFLSEIFVSTEGKAEGEIPPLEQKANGLRDRVVKGGEDFAELAKRFSDGSTKEQGGQLGSFDRDQLSPELAEKVFKLDRGGLTEVVRTKAGFLILRVDLRYEAGQQPVEKVENEIMNRIYMIRMQPTLRVYLTKLRGESFLQLKPGYTDTSAVASVPIEEVQPVPEEEKGKKKKDKKQKSGA
jgi:peptidyl-prolyl cis-trans isomerase SurA